MSFLKSEEFLQILIECCEEHYPYIAFADAFHTMRSMLLPVLYLMGTEVPKADVYHAIWHHTAPAYVIKNGVDITVK